MFKIKLILISLLTTLACAEGGFYMGIGAGYSSINDTVQAPLQFNSGATGSQTAGTAAGVIYFGYDFNTVVGIEANYQITTDGTVDSYSTSQQLIGGAILLHLPFGIMSQSLSGLSAFIKGGIDYNAINFSNVQPTCSTCVNPANVNGYTPLYGAGLEYGFKNVGYRLEWSATTDIMSTNQGQNQVNSSSNSFLASILYHF